MGCYDTVLVPCPKCGELYQAQSKSGDCFLGVYNFNDTPPEVMENVNRHAPFICEKCETKFHVEFHPIVVETNELPESIGDDLTETAGNLTMDKIRSTMENYYNRLNNR